MPHLHFHFLDWEQQLADKPFLRQPFGNRWEVYSWREAGKMARQLASGLQSLGLHRGSHIGIISQNCREWVIADIAIILAGYVSVPFYPTLSGAEIEELIELGDVDAIFIGKVADWSELQIGIAESMPIIAFPHYRGTSKVDRGYQWHQFIDQFEPLNNFQAPKLDEVWTIVFTSGTTGTPKGVELIFDTYQKSSQIATDASPNSICFDGNNRFFSFLPLNHIAERLAVEMNCLRYGGVISFAESLETFAINLRESKPTFLFAVPRIWSKFQLAVLAKIPPKQLDLLLSIPIISAIVKRKIRRQLGLDSTRLCITAAAPIASPIKQWFERLNVPIVEGYGMTETCGIASVQRLANSVSGSVGQASTGVTIDIDEATGEVLLKTDYTMRGYYKSSDKTAEVVRDGWYHTGDQGKLDADGNLFITGRIKDSFKTSKGKFIVPAPIEWDFETNPDIEQLAVVGLGCPQPLVLVVVSEMAKSKTIEQLQQSLERTLEAVNSQLHSYSKLACIVIVNDQWTTANGLLTPTLKVKRNQLNNRYQQYFNSWLETGKTIIWQQ